MQTRRKCISLFFSRYSETDAPELRGNLEINISSMHHYFLRKNMRRFRISNKSSSHVFSGYCALNDVFKYSIVSRSKVNNYFYTIFRISTILYITVLCCLNCLCVYQIMHSLFNVLLRRTF